MTSGQPSRLQNEHEGASPARRVVAFLGGEGAGQITGVGSLAISESYTPELVGKVDKILEQVVDPALCIPKVFDKVLGTQLVDQDLSRERQVEEYAQTIRRIGMSAVIGKTSNVFIRGAIEGDAEGPWKKRLLRYGEGQLVDMAVTIGSIAAMNHLMPESAKEKMVDIVAGTMEKFCDCDDERKEQLREVAKLSVATLIPQGIGNIAGFLRTENSRS